MTRKQNEPASPTDADLQAGRSSADATSQPRKQTPDGLPLGPPVFGRWSWITTIIPLIVYLGCNFFGGYLEGMRVEHLNQEELQAAEEGAAEEAVAEESGAGTTADDGNDRFDDIFEEASEPEGQQAQDGLTRWLGDWFPYEKTWYPSTYTLTVIIVSALIVLGLPGYFRAPFRISWLAPLVGAVGILVWVGLWYLDTRFLGIGPAVAPYLMGGRSTFNPFEHLADTPTWLYQFLAIRLFGMVVMVPIIEEFFLRGFLMRYIDDPDWDQIPLGLATRKAILGVLVYGAFSHPGELLAAIVWFGMVTWLYLRTRSIWDCVVAHAVTNGLLAGFVLYTKQWELW